MANRNAYLAVYGAVYTPVNRAVNRAVYKAFAERGTVSHAVNQTMARAVYRVAGEIVFWAVVQYVGPPPPGLELYLGSGT